MKRIWIVTCEDYEGMDNEVRRAFYDEKRARDYARKKTNKSIRNRGRLHAWYYEVLPVKMFED